MAYPCYGQTVQETALNLRRGGMDYRRIRAALMSTFPSLKCWPSEGTIRMWYKADEAGAAGGAPREAPSTLAERIGELRQGRKLPKSLGELCDLLDRGPAAVRAAIGELRAGGLLVELDEASGVLHQPEQPAVSAEPHYVTSPSIGEGVHRAMFGVCSDFHAGSIFARADVVAALYEHWAWVMREEGLESWDVYVAGNILEGPGKNNFNLHEIASGGHTMDGQFGLLLEMVPKITGITTWVLTGDCHEGWWAKEVGLNVGMHLERFAADHGREDIRYLGFMQKDVIYRCPEGDCVVRLFHPGGGTAYALSYRPQKIVEALQGGTKPDVLIIGHFHKAEHIPGYRNVEVLQAGCCQDQSSFMAKKSLAAHVGGWTVTMWMDESGVIRRFLPEWNGFFNKEFYLSRRLPVEVGGVRRLVPVAGGGDE